MKSIEDINILDCPVCRGPAVLQEENGWCFYVECLDCGSHSAEIGYKNDEDRLTAANQVADLWNLGKVIPAGAGE